MFVLTFNFFKALHHFDIFNNNYNTIIFAALEDVEDKLHIFAPPCNILYVLNSLNSTLSGRLYQGVILVVLVIIHSRKFNM